MQIHANDVLSPNTLLTVQNSQFFFKVSTVVVFNVKNGNIGVKYLKFVVFVLQIYNIHGQ